MAASLAPLIDRHRVVLCVGSGGVGKTTVTAAFGLAAAQRGKRVLCLTIDPAKRLANSLGFSRIATDEQRVDPELFRQAGIEVSGALTVMMLDTKRTFDELVIRHASSPEARDRILKNRLYQYVSTTLAGTQEYMAMEKLLAVKNDSNYDLIVLDTPPTSNALDFLDAPERLVNVLDSAAVGWLTKAFEKSGRFSLNLVAKSFAVVLKGISRLTGGGFLEQIAEFISDLNELFGGFKTRAREVASAFRGEEFAYVLVTTPAPAAIREATFFAERLRELGMRNNALVVNRVHRPPRNEVSPSDVESAIQRHDLGLLGPTGPERLLRTITEERERAESDQRSLSLLEPALAADPRGQKPIRVDIPALPGDVHDLGTLAGIAKLIAP